MSLPEGHTYLWNGDPQVRRIGVDRLLTCKVAEWEKHKGRYRPLCWIVPVSILSGNPLPREKALARYQSARRRGRSAFLTRLRRCETGYYEAQAQEEDPGPVILPFRK